MSKIHRILNRLRLILPLPFFIFLVYIATPQVIFCIIGFFILIIALAIRVWASGYIYKMERLAKDGPYSFCRHPLYFGNFLIGLAFCIATSQLIALIIFIILFPIIYYILIIEEEKFLEDNYKEEFVEYKKNTPCFIPYKLNKIRKHHSNTTTFNFQLAKKNREPATALIFLLFYIFYIVVIAMKNILLIL